MAVAGDLTVGEKSPVSACSRRGQRGRSGMTGGAVLSVTLCLKMNFLFFLNCLNSVVFCLFCVELNRAPKIMKIFV